MKCGDASPLLDGATRRALKQRRLAAALHIVVANTQWLRKQRTALHFGLSKCHSSITHKLSHGNFSLVFFNAHRCVDITIIILSEKTPESRMDNKWIK
ncbi:MAG: hypothetical protein ACYDC8_00730 [Gammaproteobacteria bacterium]